MNLDRDELFYDGDEPPPAPNKNDQLNDDLDDLFAQEDTTISTVTDERWKVLIVDDEEDIHQITHFVLDDYVYQGKRLWLLSAYSAEEAKMLFQQHADTALILLDVVMETNDAGLKLVKYIREVEQNHFVRIILRTGQPGYAPEKEVILKYDINDYKNKTELTDQKLFTVITASLRSYSDIMTIESYRQNLEEKVAARTIELQEKNQVLLRLNQDKNEFLGIAAHDLKNPLASIQSLANLIRTSFDDFARDKVIDFARMIEISSQRMFELIKNLLDVNAIESGKTNLSFNELDMNHLIQRQLENHLNAAHNKNLHLHFQETTDKFIVWADKSATMQVLDNLISNSIKYSPKGKNVYLRVSDHGNQIRFEVQDEGPGLAEKDRAKLFGKFARLTPRPTGNEHSTGLGLFIVKKLVESMEGKVWCETEIGKGATFMVELPVPTQANQLADLN